MSLNGGSQICLCLRQIGIDHGQRIDRHQLIFLAPCLHREIFFAGPQGKRREDVPVAPVGQRLYRGLAQADRSKLIPVPP